MLRLPVQYTADEKANLIIQKHITNQILELMKVVMVNCDMDTENFDEQDEIFLDYVESYFPLNYPSDKMAETFYGFYHLLKSEEEFVPKLAMEYLMAELLCSHIEFSEDAGLSLEVPIENEREYVLSIIVSELDLKGLREEVACEVNQYLSQFENLREYTETCFWDTDYELLNQYSEEQLLESEANDTLGIGLEAKERFIIPAKWVE